MNIEKNPGRFEVGHFYQERCEGRVFLFVEYGNNEYGDVAFLFALPGTGHQEAMTGGQAYARFGAAAIRGPEKPKVMTPHLLLCAEGEHCFPSGWRPNLGDNQSQIRVCPVCGLVQHRSDNIDPWIISTSYCGLTSERP